MREALRSLERAVAAWTAQDAELDAEIAALEAAGVLTVPAEGELPGPDLDPDCAPPAALQAWLADLSSALPSDECHPAAADRTGPKISRPGRRDRAGVAHLDSQRVGPPICCRPGRRWLVWPKTHVLPG